MRKLLPPIKVDNTRYLTVATRQETRVAVIGTATIALLLLTASGGVSKSGSGTDTSVASSAATTPSAASTATSGSQTGSGGASAGTLAGRINGSGSTFQLTFQQSAIQTFKNVQPNLSVSYGGGGSGKGQSDLASRLVNYAGSDSPIPASEQSTFKGTVLYFPVVIGPITVAYNLPGVANLKLSAPVIAQIFEAKITKWDAPAIKAENPGVNLPSSPITIARRSDSSGTTQNFSQFLAEAAPGVWTLGTGSTINWPSTSVSGSGNGGVAAIVKSTKGAIGYVDYADAKVARLTFASVENKVGLYVAPTPASASDAAARATVAPNLTFSAIWAPGATSYPITYQSWDLVFEHQSSASTAKELQAYIGYLVGPGQKLLPGLGYAPLPPSLQQKTEAQLAKIGS